MCHFDGLVDQRGTKVYLTRSRVRTLLAYIGCRLLTCMRECGWGWERKGGGGRVGGVKGQEGGRGERERERSGSEGKR